MSAPRARFPREWAERVQRLRVPSGFALLAAFALLARPTLGSALIGMACGLPGMALRAWAAGHLRKNMELIDGGPYAWVRNPLYIGTLIMALGLVSASLNPWLLLLTAVYFLFVYLPVMEREEAHLHQIFPQWREYARRVNQLFPKPPTQAGTSHFSWEQYWRNREYLAFLAWLTASALLIVRALL
jgi:hypothetical protein